jgi:hypothetical protein
MPTYRYYCLDSTGRIDSGEWFNADSDEEAVAMIQLLHPDNRCEVWGGRRLIGSTVPQDRQQSA